jgi:hypothetical protein
MEMALRQLNSVVLFSPVVPDFVVMRSFVLLFRLYLSWSRVMHIITLQLVTDEISTVYV